MVGERILNFISGGNPVLIVHLAAQTDANGNPRRVYVAFGHRGEILGVEDEGYEGDDVVTKRWPGVPITERIEITPKAYKFYTARYREK